MKELNSAWLLLSAKNPLDTEVVCITELDNEEILNAIKLLRENGEITKDTSSTR